MVIPLFTWSKFISALVLTAQLVSSAVVSPTPAQTFHGVSGSGAWWPKDLHQFPEAQRQQLANLLFSQEGLGLSGYRWNIGGGGVNVSNPTRAPETFYVSPGVYDWGKDAQGVYFMQEANKRGVEITAFVNSAPAPLTAGRASCNSNFVTGSGDAYGRFLADVLQRFVQQGINIRYISPMNEPDNSFGPSPCGQEGMIVRPNQRAEVVNTLWNALSSRGLAQQIGIIVDEASNLNLATSQYDAWLGQVLDKVAALAHHTYDFPSDASYTSYVTDTARRFPGKRTWMTEVCCSMGNADGSGRGWSQGYDPTIRNALMWSGLVFQSFNVVNETHYDWWVLLSKEVGCSVTASGCATSVNTAGWNDGLIYYDGNFASNRNYQFYITKHFWTYKHFGNFVKPGMQRLPVISFLSTEAALRPYVLVTSSSTQFNVIVMNPFSSANALSLTFPSRACAISAFRTSASQDFASVQLPTSGSNGVWTMQLPTMTLTSYVFNKC